MEALIRLRARLLERYHKRPTRVAWAEYVYVCEIIEEERVNTCHCLRGPRR